MGEREANIEHLPGEQLRSLTHPYRSKAKGMALAKEPHCTPKSQRNVSERLKYFRSSLPYIYKIYAETHASGTPASLSLFFSCAY